MSIEFEGCLCYLVVAALHEILFEGDRVVDERVGLYVLRGEQFELSVELRDSVLGQQTKQVHPEQLVLE